MATYIYRTVNRIRVIYRDPDGNEQMEYFRTFNQAKFLKEHPGYTIKNIDKRLIKMKLSMDAFIEHAEVIE